MAGRAPRRAARTVSLAEVERRIAAGWPAGVTLVVGENAYARDAAWTALLAALAPADDRFATTVFGDEGAEIGRVVSAALSAGMFAKRRVVVVRDLTTLTGDPEPIERFAAGAPGDSFVLVGGVKLDLRLKLHKALVAAAADRVLSFGALDRRDLEKILRELAAERALTLTREAAELLLEACVGDAVRLRSELDKLRSWLGGDGPGKVDGATLRAVAVSGEGALGGFEVADAIVARDRAAALDAVRRLVRAGDEPIRIVGGLAWQARGLLAAVAALAAGRSARDGLREARVPPFKHAALENAARRWRFEEVLAFPAKLLAADRALKSRQLSGGAVLEDLVQSLVEPEPGTTPRRTPRT